jgi:hypothetical protein
VIFQAVGTYSLSLSFKGLMLLHKSRKIGVLSLTTKAELIVCLPMVWATWIRFPVRFSLITMSVMALEAVKFHLYFKSLHLFVFFLPLFTFKNVRSAVGFSP